MADDLVSQDEVEKLLAELQGGAQPAAAAGAPVVGTASPAATTPRPAPAAADGNISQSDIDFLFRQAEQAIASINEPVATAPPAGVSPFTLPEFGGAPSSTEAATLELIRDVELDLRIELGRTHMYLEDVLKLCKGAVVPLDKMAGDPVDIFVNGRLVARGEVLVLNDNFCVRVAELVAGDATAGAA
ncbi:MAG TPA: flagellar motor switch protein FliN [Pirellulales bacterium]|jgi:flagellar motor switch protein FliN/FliY|nr:flagellar motor switch protein FliN [Pirellulales bacterium]